MTDYSDLTIDDLNKKWRSIDKIKFADEALALRDEIQRRLSLGEKITPNPYEKYHTFWARFWAGMIDAIVFIPIFIFDIWAWSSFNSVPLLISWFVLFRISFIAYNVISHGYYGKTIGKHICKVKVLDLSETALSIKQALLRDSFPIALLILALPFELALVAKGINPYSPDVQTTITAISSSFGWIWFTIEVVTMLCSKKRRALHDYIASSVVVKIS